MFKKLTALFLFVFSQYALATAPMTEQQQQAAFTRIFSMAVVGPATVSLTDQAKIQVPENMAWLPKLQANEFMELLGNTKQPTRLGIIISAEDETDWMADISYEASGYISDEDAKNWDADELFESLQEGTESQNKWRREQKTGELELIGWIEKPTYEQATHRLVWSVEAKEVGEYADPNVTDNVVNYNTYVLGREGYIELNFITGVQAIKANKVIAKDLLSRIQFNNGKTYADYNEATDKTAEYGLAALIGGSVLAKKLGFFAMIAAFVAKFWKIALIAIFAIFPFLKKVFSKKTVEFNEPQASDKKEESKSRIVE